MGIEMPNTTNADVYNEFIDIRDVLMPDFYEHQFRGAQRIKESILNINNFSSKAEIKSIISLGCGAGEIEMTLAYLMPTLEKITCVEESGISIARLNSVKKYLNGGIGDVKVESNEKGGYQLAKDRVDTHPAFLKEFYKWRMREITNALGRNPEKNKAILVNNILKQDIDHLLRKIGYQRKNQTPISTQRALYEFINESFSFLSCSLFKEINKPPIDIDGLFDNPPAAFGLEDNNQWSVTPRKRQQDKEFCHDFWESFLLWRYAQISPTLNPEILIQQLLKREIHALSEGLVSLTVQESNVEYYIAREIGQSNSDPIQNVHEHTLLMIVGHTIPHFLGWKDLHGNLKNRDTLPKYILIDFHENFDTAVSAVTNGDTHLEVMDQCKENCKQTSSPCTYGLCTVRADESTIYRGIAFTLLKRRPKCPFLGKKVPFIEENNLHIFSNGENQLSKYVLRVKTHQLNKSSSEFIRDFLELEYIEIDKFAYQNGYGHMNAWFLTRQLKNVKVANNIYRKALGRFLKEELFEAAHKGTQSNEKILKKDVQDAFSFFKHILIGAIKPFDSYLTFAEYLRLSKTMPLLEDIEEQRNSDTTGEAHNSNPSPRMQISCACCKQDPQPPCQRNAFATSKELIVTPFNLFQNRYPTADGLYYAMLADPGCSLITPPSLSAEKRHKMCDLDFEFWKAEKILMLHNEAFHMSKDDHENPSPIQAQCQDIFRTIHHTPVAYDMDVAKDSTVRNLIDEQTFVCIPIYYGGVPLLYILAKPRNLLLLSASREMVEQLARNLEKTIKKHINNPAAIEKFFFNVIKELDTEISKDVGVDSDENNKGIDEKELKKYLKDLISNAQSKNWKKWMATFPEINIRNIEEIQAEKRQLLRIVKTQTQKLKRDARWNISHIISKYQFFKEIQGEVGKNTHLQYVPQYHDSLIDNILSEISSFFDGLGQLQNDWTIDRKIYFKIIDWAIKTFENLKTNKNQDDFILLKAFFYRAVDKDEVLFRFSESEIEAIIRIILFDFINNNIENYKPDLGTYSIQMQAIKPHLTIWREDILKLFELINSLSKGNIRLYTTTNNLDDDIRITKFGLQFNFDKQLKYENKGSNESQFIIICNQLYSNKYKSPGYFKIDVLKLFWKIKYKVTNVDKIDTYSDCSLETDFWIE